MNFLAHCYLAGTSDEVKIGNFIGDYVKGREYEKYSDDIRTGILMHRHIDEFIDTHRIAKKSMSFFREKYHLYSGVVIDIIYDHFLSVEWENYSDVPLEQFIAELHSTLQENMIKLPQKVQDFVPRFIEYRWLNSYISIGGIEKVLKGMSKYTSLPKESKFAICTLEANYKVLRQHFNEFFPQIIEYISYKYFVSHPYHLRRYD